MTIYTYDNVYVSWNDVSRYCGNIAHDIEQPIGHIIALNTGAIIPSTILSYYLKVNNIVIYSELSTITHLIESEQYCQKVLLVTDIINENNNDLNNIYAQLSNSHLLGKVITCSLIKKRTVQLPYSIIPGKVITNFNWVFFPWEIGPV